MLVPTRSLLSAAIMLVMSATAASAQESERTPVQAYRQVLMESLDRHSRAIRSIVEGGVPEAAPHLVDHAVAVEGLARMLADVFPEGSGEGTRARPEIWEAPELFREKNAEFVGLAAALVEAARNGDSEAAGEAARALSSGCRSCHSEFRARPRQSEGSGRP